MDVQDPRSPLHGRACADRNERRRAGQDLPLRAMRARERVRRLACLSVAAVTMNSVARRMFDLVEPIGVIPYSADEPNETMFALGFTNYWDIYFAGRAAPLGIVPAEVVDALFYNFAPGEVARHIPKVWSTTTPDAALAARQIGCVKALRRILGDHVDAPAFARASELLLEAATSAPYEGRPMYAALRAIPIPDDVVARLFH